MASVKVFGSPASTEVARVLACLWEKDVDFQLVRMDKYKGKHKIPEFIRQVTYKDGDKELTDSRKICRHVCEKYAQQGTRKLLDSGMLKRIEDCLKEEKEKFEEPSTKLVLYLAFQPYINVNIDETVINDHASKLATVLDSYEKLLGNTQFLAGNDFTLADLYHLPNSHYLVNKTTTGYNMFSSRKNVSRWWEEISSRPSWKMVVQMQEQHPGNFSKEKEQPPGTGTNNDNN